MNEERRRELAELVRQLRAVSARLETMKLNESHASIQEHLETAEEHVDSAIDHMQLSIERSLATHGVTVVKRAGPATRLRKANERKKS